MQKDNNKTTTMSEQTVKTKRKRRQKINKQKVYACKLKAKVMEGSEIYKASEITLTNYL